MTYVPWVQLSFDGLTSSAEASHVKTLVPLASRLASLVLEAASGTSSLALLQTYARAWSSSKTSQAEQSSGSIPCAEAWESSGMRRYRSLLRQAMSGLRTDETASSLLPTLTAKPYGSNKGGALGRVGEPRESLWTLARQMLPTLCRRDYRDPGPARKRAGGADLPQTIGGHLCPTWCEWFMGFPEGHTLPMTLAKISKDASRKRAQRFIKASHCEKCGVTGVKLERHHHDHQKPLDVEVLCSRCHTVADQLLGNRPVRQTKTCMVCSLEFAGYTHSRGKTCGQACLAKAGATNARKRWGDEPTTQECLDILNLRTLGLSERSISKRLGIGRSRIRRVLASRP